MRLTNGEVILCPTCPGQGEFIGVITEESAVVTHTLPIDNRNKIDLRVELNFVDQDGGKSVATHAYVSHNKLQQVGVRIRKKSDGYIADEARVEKSIERGKEGLKTTMVERIGRCASAGCGMDCPAMGKHGAFETILHTSFANRNKKK